jgi:glutamate dehydrogenase (NADP+)
MALSDHVDLSGFIEGVKRRNPGQPEFVQAVQEVAEDIFEFIADKEQYHRWQILRRIAEPDRVVSFRVVWQDDNNNIACSAVGVCRTTMPSARTKAASASTRP